MRILKAPRFPAALPETAHWFATNNNSRFGETPTSTPSPKNAAVATLPPPSRMRKYFLMKKPVAIGKQC
jgi:hypothetical protein